MNLNTDADKNKINSLVTQLTKKDLPYITARRAGL